MSQLFSQLGIEPVALIWQALNFIVVLVVLFYFVYTPLSELVAERSKKIEKGLEDAVCAAGELSRAEEAFEARLSEAENEALGVMRQAEQDAQAHSQKLVAKGEERATAIVAEARTLAAHARDEEMWALEDRAKEFVTSVLAKTVALDPRAVDEALIAQAADLVRAELHAQKAA
ncbi:hypothetical protein COU19_00945 [Candidatus Kaiserbacteria bacterium CG10_big_fil_rev_8_21_14_0_10_56_12]|uniref:ATP synthase subunit b n=1 Tax=Candidatus Kaiserbacteria bacterium CG10_big_fil_rev_8_21_14_0_10_56_12 TaxID=1974611 RepID=A0A2H0UAA5_9BACT|nr:MAG: hypothetical protein COU19_00945 [Candidatus Kaiserbacteria bacterium CG10_big_fil_rev_8_21_14_0_10_56_12]